MRLLPERKRARNRRKGQDRKNDRGREGEREKEKERERARARARERKIESERERKKERKGDGLSRLIASLAKHGSFHFVKLPFFHLFSCGVLGCSSLKQCALCALCTFCIGEFKCPRLVRRTRHYKASS